MHTVVGLVAFACAAVAFAAPNLNVGSKRFTESYILGEILKQTAQSAGETSATHSQGLGNTAIVLNALTTGSIDVYPEYTGTIAQEILKGPAAMTLEAMRAGEISRACPISRRIPTCGSDFHRNSSGAPTAGPA